MRQYCSVCQYPLTTCVCSVIRRVKSPVSISIIQHPKEVMHAKNTARLITLCLENTSVVVSSNNDQMTSLKRRCETLPTALLYPCSHSHSWEQTTASGPPLSHLVVLDGSWRQAFGLWQQHAWLQTLPAYHFSSAPSSDYAIRHTGNRHHVSTLEAVAYALSSRFQTDVSPLYRLQARMQEFWQGPPEHRR
ncbi:tRNA-uridine aminocarboxypropyltransferase [Alteromonas sp. H39]|uniref:tRNA-uridine aminocarboxypropyltransferase n=1 Tax=Alteromonas sp. H39 TaxID=3389876 RepID=UPI0039DF4A3F